jgi:hypothetical protein
LTLEPSTPNAHSAILASSFGVPFVYLRQPGLELEAANVASVVIIDVDSEREEDQIWILGVDSALRRL